MNSLFYSGFEEYRSCKIVVIPGRYNYVPMAYAFQKDSPYFAIFNYYIKAMKEKGSIDQIIEKYAPAPQICPDLTGEALGFNSCISAFLVLIGGAAAGLILLAIELVSKKTGSNWTWLEWYGKESEVILNVEEEHAGNDEKIGDGMETSEAEEPGPPPGPSNTNAWTQSEEVQEPTTTTADIEVRG